MSREATPGRFAPGPLARRAATAGALALQWVHPRLGVRPSDVFVASFPKSGSTWLRFLLANILSLEELEGREVDYTLLNGDLAAEYDLHRYPRIESGSFPRFLKTHRPFEARRFGRHRACFLVRHPGDTMVSYFEYLRATRGRHRYRGDLSSFIRSETHGLPAWRRHAWSWGANADHRLSYEALHDDAAGALRGLFASLSVPTPDAATLEEAVARSSFAAVRRIEETRGLDPSARRHLDPGFRFARRGTVGDWREVFSAEDRDYVESALRDAPPQIAKDFIDRP